MNNPCAFWKCTICGNENAAWNCPCALCGHARKPVTNEAPPTEMTSLREIKDKLDALQKTVDFWASETKAIAESQGKLLAVLNDIGGNISTNDSLIMGHLQAIDNRLDALDAGLHETAMRNHQQVRAAFEETCRRLDARDNAIFLGRMESMKPEPRKKARRRQER